MSDEHQSIAALKVFRERMDNPRIPKPNRNWTGDLIPEPWLSKGSENRPPMAWACEIHYWEKSSSGYKNAVEWWKKWCSNQDRSDIGHGGKELGSRIYDSWTIMGAVMAFNSPGVESDVVIPMARFFRRHWILQALGGVPQSQAQSWYSGPTVTFTGMRSISKDGEARLSGENNSLDSIFAMATGMGWRWKRPNYPTAVEICMNLAMGLTDYEQSMMISMVNGQIGIESFLAVFAADTPGWVTRVPMEISRWSDGSAGTIVYRDVSVSTPPCYGMLMRGTHSKPADYLRTHLEGDPISLYKSSGKPGNAWEQGGKWFAKAERHAELTLPSLSHRTFLFRIDSEGISVNGKNEPGQPPVEPPVEPPTKPPVEPPTKPPIQPPVNPGESVMYHLDSAMKQYSWGNKQASLNHTKRAEALLEGEIGRRRR